MIPGRESNTYSCKTLARIDVEFLQRYNENVGSIYSEWDSPQLEDQMKIRICIVPLFCFCVPGSRYTLSWFYFAKLLEWVKYQNCNCNSGARERATKAGDMQERKVVVGSLSTKASDRRQSGYFSPLQIEEELFLV